MRKSVELFRLIFIAISLVLIFGVGIKAFENQNATDFPVFYNAVQIWEEGSNPYDTATMKVRIEKYKALNHNEANSQFWWGFWYPPWILPPLALFSLFSFGIASTCWNVMIAISLALALLAAIQLGNRNTNPNLLAVVGPILLLLPSIAITLQRQQVTPFLALATIGILAGPKRLLLGSLGLTALLIKPHLAWLLVVTLGIRRGLRPVLLSAAFIVGLFVLACIPNSDIFAEWVVGLSRPPLFQETSDLSGLTRGILAARSTSPPFWPVVTYPIIGLICILVMVPKKVSESVFVLRVLSLGMIFAPYSHQHDHVILLPSVAILLASYLQAGRSSMDFLCRLLVILLPLSAGLLLFSQRPSTFILIPIAALIVSYIFEPPLSESRNS